MRTIEIEDDAAVLIFNEDSNYLLLPPVAEEDEIPYHIELAYATAEALGSEEIVEAIFEVVDGTLEAINAQGRLN